MLLAPGAEDRCCLRSSLELGPKSQNGTASVSSWAVLVCPISPGSVSGQRVLWLGSFLSDTAVLFRKVRAIRKPDRAVPLRVNLFQPVSVIKWNMLALTLKVSKLQSTAHPCDRAHVLHEEEIWFVGLRTGWSVLCWAESWIWLVTELAALKCKTLCRATQR